jgi:hypothetical protein
MGIHRPIKAHPPAGLLSMLQGLNRDELIQLSDLEKKQFLEEKIGLALDELTRMEAVPTLWQLTWLRAAIASAGLGSFEQSLRELSDAVGSDPLPDHLMSAWLNATRRECSGLDNLRQSLDSLKRRAM